MGKIENAQRIGSMQIHKALKPFGAILYRPHLLGSTDSPPLGLPRGRRATGAAVGQTRERGEIDRLHHLLSSLLAVLFFGLDLPNHSRFDFCPLAFEQTHLGSITADEQLDLFGVGFALLWLGRTACALVALLVLCLQQLAGLLILPLFRGRSCCFCLPTPRGLTDLDSHPVCQQVGGLGKGHPEPQTHQVFQLQRRQAAWLQA